MCIFKQKRKKKKSKTCVDCLIVLLEARTIAPNGTYEMKVIFKDTVRYRYNVKRKIDRKKKINGLLGCLKKEGE